MTKHYVKNFVLVIILLTVTYGAGFATGRYAHPEMVSAQERQAPKEFEVFLQVWQIANEYFIDRDKLDSQKMIYGSINGLLRVLGDEGHTRFLPPKEAEAQKESISGKFYGIGATVQSQDGYVLIVAPIAGSPAEEAGILAGDLVTHVDGEDIYDMPLEDAINLIKGDEGTEVHLTIYRPDDQKELEFTIIRGEIKQPAATWTIVPETEIGLLRMSQFSANLEENVLQGITALQEDGATSIILDLRNNPGGLLDQAIKVASHFLKEGNVLLEEDFQGNRTAYAVLPDGKAQDVPIVVLINQGSASASEIFAGAMQDHERAVVIGKKTFGTGTVLHPFDLSDGSTLLLGVSQWLTPQGRLIRQQGVAPDIAVELEEGAFMVSPGVVSRMTLPELVGSGDNQLLKALEELGVTLPDPPAKQGMRETQMEE